MDKAKETSAITLSKNKIKKISEKQILVDDESKNSNLFENYNNSNKPLSRGWYDIVSLNLRYIDSKTFNKYCPSNERKKNLFKILATTRCFSFGFREFEGCKKNIKKILPELRNNFFSKNNNYNRFLFDFFLKVFLSKRVSKEEIPKEFSKVSINEFKNLINVIDDESKFYFYVKKLISYLQTDEENNINQDSEENSSVDSNASQKQEKEKLKKIQLKKVDQNKDKPTSSNSETNNFNNSFIKQELNYKVFTKQFDTFTKAERLISYPELKQLRQKFDEECKDNTKLINNLAKKLEKLLYSLDFSTWKFDQEEGFFDSSRFSQFIANPKNSNIFKLENENTEKNTVVSLLLDNSGSMRGKPIVTSAMTAEIITKTLEKCRVNVEILGFTTKEWKGGRSKKLWEKKNKDSNPGRLNDLLHIVYKDADTPWNQTKLNLGLVLKDGLLKENIDGEALIWASSRLKKRNEKKKILIVISDGAPVDDATLSSNNSNILDNHLKDVVSEIEKKKTIDIIAIGIGHDVSKYYSRAFTIDDVDKLGEIIIDNLTEILKEKR